METHQRKVSLSYLLIRFGIMNLMTAGLVLFCWFASLTILQSRGVIHYANYSEQVVNQFIEQQKKKATFSSKGLPQTITYALFNHDGVIKHTNADKKQQERLIESYRQLDTDAIGIAHHTYPNQTTAIFNYDYRIQYVNQTMQQYLPPYEYLSIGLCLFVLVSTLLFSMRNLRKKIVQNLAYFEKFSENITQQTLDFEPIHSEINEFDDALQTMDTMRKTLTESLRSQWLAEQRRQMEIVALAHDLKTPLTLIKGYTALLLEDTLSVEQKNCVQIIEKNSNHAKDYVDLMLTASVGADERAEGVAIGDLANKFASKAKEMSHLITTNQTINESQGLVCVVKYARLLRMFTNIVRNAIEHTPNEGEIFVSFAIKDQTTFRIEIIDGGSGFSAEALQHACERFWREDRARKSDGHTGIGLWFANEVVIEHQGELMLTNSVAGGKVCIELPIFSG
ncbi:HAMP domain-containing sensor histidine kinase [uncultured Enterococcus sp.]|uniref:sensor histidine kinase n=1 Tax=uncultured Enterococcus sp. TaxID=167972 RepID=UPI002591AEB3|nr:HAMP domain-containing sensor histidine kinase [uncultured Enterococcus sp.]